MSIFSGRIIGRSGNFNRFKTQSFSSTKLKISFIDKTQLMSRSSMILKDLLEILGLIYFIKKLSGIIWKNQKESVQ